MLKKLTVFLVFPALFLISIGTSQQPSLAQDDEIELKLHILYPQADSPVYAGFPDEPHAITIEVSILAGPSEWTLVSGPMSALRAMIPEDVTVLIGGEETEILSWSLHFPNCFIPEGCLSLEEDGDYIIVKVPYVIAYTAVLIEFSPQVLAQFISVDFEHPIETSSGERTALSSGITDLELGGDPKPEWATEPPGLILRPKHLETTVCGLGLCYRFGGQEGFVKATFGLPEQPMTATLKLRHGFFARYGVFAPVQITVNEQVAREIYPAAQNQIIEDEFDISGFLHQGENTLKIQVVTPDRDPVIVDTNKPYYLIQRLELHLTSTSHNGDG